MSRKRPISTAFRRLTRAFALAGGFSALSLLPSLHADTPPEVIPAPVLPPEVRLANDAASQAKFRNLHFFTEGGGMHISPGLLKLSDDVAIRPIRKPILSLKKREYRNRWGLNWSDEAQRPEGLFDVPYKGMSVGVLGCVACHSGRAAGQYIVGLGNKNIDVYAIGRDAYLAERVWKHIGHLGKKNDDYKYVEKTAMEFALTLSNPSYTNLTQGMVPTAAIRTWFYRIAGRPFPENSPRSAVKVPSLFGYGMKRQVGQFCDGIGNGKYAGWGMAVELVANQKPEVVRENLEKAEAAEQLLSDFLPPKYPFTVDVERAARGKQVFARTCAACHGKYETDPGGLPVYEAPHYIPWEVVETDHDRLEGTTEEFLELIRSSPLHDVIQATDKGKGYFAPRLNGIWARFPYLHNGSVPTIAALLTSPEKRPAAFSLHDAGEASRFDPVRLGLTMPAAGSRDERKLLKYAKKGRRDVYSTARVGHSAQGHDFYTELDEGTKGELIEYLKTL